MLAAKDAFEACAQRLNTTWRQTFATECQCMQSAMDNAYVFYHTHTHTYTQFSDGGNQQTMNRQQTTAGSQPVVNIFKQNKQLIK
jgi:hypothetical protein